MHANFLSCSIHKCAPEELSLEYYTIESNKGFGPTVALRVGMQSPQKEIYDICKPLLTTRSLSDVENVVSKVFTDDAVFTHAFIISKGKESIVRTYQFWKLVNKQIGFDIENAGTQAPQSGICMQKAQKYLLPLCPTLLYQFHSTHYSCANRCEAQLVCLKDMQQLVPDSGPRFCALTRILSALHCSPVGQGGSSCAGEFQ